MATEKRLIDAIKVADKVSAIHFYITGLRNGKVLLNKYMEDYRCEVLRILSEAPTVDAVEVVRCKDCKHFVADTKVGGKWISVKDRLPETYTRVLVRVNGYKEILVGWYTETFKDSNNEKFDCWSIEYKLSERRMEPVTHWMPLPQPPKGE